MTQGNDTEKNTIKDIDGNDLRFYDGWREDQPSNKLNHPNDKHTTGEYEDCVRQFGLEGWNDAICSRTWYVDRQRFLVNPCPHEKFVTPARISTYA